jgi:hypothetical protein
MPRHRAPTARTPKSKSVSKPSAVRDDRDDGVFLHVIGDSHASLFSGIDGLQPVWPEVSNDALPGVRTVRLGSRLAHSLTRPGHELRALMGRVIGKVPRDASVLLALGEIDCRCHVVPQAEKTGRRIESVAKALARGYVRAACAIAKGRRLGFLAAPPPSSLPVIDPCFPTRGTFEERRAATQSFNSTLGEEARKNGCAWVCMDSALIDERGERREAMFQDLIHCRVTAVPAACEALVRAGLVPVARADELRHAGAALARVPWRPAAASIYVPPRIIGMIPPRHDTGAAIEMSLLDRAALECVWMGAKRVAIYGAGKHTARVGLKFLRRRGLEVTAILDDRSKLNEMHGVPVLRPRDKSAKYDAVVLSSDAHEDVLAGKSAELFTTRGLRVVRIYGWREPWPGMRFEQ